MPRKLQTLGDHIRKRRIERGMLQREVAAVLDVDESSVNAWERNRHQPVLRVHPAIAAFLGYEPDAVPQDAPIGFRIASKRRRLGISRRQLATEVGVDEGTILRWERGWISDKANPRVRRALENWTSNAPHV